MTVKSHKERSIVGIQYNNTSPILVWGTGSAPAPAPIPVLMIYMTLSTSNFEGPQEFTVLREIELSCQNQGQCQNFPSSQVIKIS